MPTRSLLTFLLLLGALAFASGSARALTSPGEAVCRTLYDAAWSGPHGKEAGEAWRGGLDVLDEGGGIMAPGLHTAWTAAQGRSPTALPEAPGVRGTLDGHDQICVNFLDVCTPVFEALDEL